MILGLALKTGAELPGRWETHAAPLSGHLIGIAASPGQLIAVGQGGVILESVNVADWSRVPQAATSGDFYCVTFGKGLFVAGGTLGCLMAISPNGRNWTNIQSTAGIHANFGVTFGGGRFVAVGRGTTPTPNCRLITSTNGINWETVTRPTTNTLRAVTFGNGKYIAVGDHGAIVASADAATWTVQNSGTEHHLRSIVFTGREFLAGGDSSTLLTSGDGITWLSVPFSSFDVRGLAACGTATVALGTLAGEGRIQSSTDGLSWTAGTFSLDGPLNAVVHYGSGRFIAVGNNGLIAESTIWADPPVNRWMQTSGGFWHEPGAWSLGHIPSWQDRSIVLTNAGSKELEINATTVRDYPESLHVNELILGATEESDNILTLNRAGLTTPLLIATALRIPPNTSLLNIGSALEAPSLELSGLLAFAENARLLFRDRIEVGVIGPGTVTQSGGALASARVRLGLNFTGTWNQHAGSHEVEVMTLLGGSVYNLYSGSLTVNGDLQVGNTWLAGAPQLNLAGGSAMVHGTLVVAQGEGTLTNGLLTTTNTSLAGANARFVQTGGEHRVRNELDIQGIYTLRKGVLTFKTLRLTGQLELTGGDASGGDVALSGGILKANNRRIFSRLTVTTNSIIDFQEGPATVHFLSAGAWTGPLLLTNWRPAVHHFGIGDHVTPLAAAELAQIRFINPGGFPVGAYHARRAANGEIFPVPRLNYEVSASKLVLAWPAGYRLLTATNVAGPYSLMTNAISPFSASYTDPQRYFTITNEN